MPRRFQGALGRSSPAWVRLWARDSTAIAGSQFAALAVTTTLTIIVARYLGPSEFGIFAGLLGLAQLIGTLAALGVSTWLLRDFSNAIAGEQDREIGNRMLSASLAFTGTMAGLLTLGSLIVSSLLGSSTELTLALVALLGYLGLLACAILLEVVFRAHRRLSRIVVATLVDKGSLACVVAAVVVLEGGIAGIAAGYLAAGVLRICWDLYALFIDDLASFSRPSLGDIRLVVRNSIPFALGTAVPTAVVRLDVFLIGFVSSVSAGLYAVSDRFLNVLLVIPVVGASALYPHLARQGDPLRASWSAAAMLALLGAALGGVGILVAPIVVPLLLGARYEAAVPGVRIMLVAAPIMFAAHILMAGMFSSGNERRVLLVMLPCSLGGTVFVLAGQALLGFHGATAGYVARTVLLVFGLATLSVVLHRGSSSSPPPAERAGARKESTGEEGARGPLNLPQVEA